MMSMSKTETFIVLISLSPYASLPRAPVPVIASENSGLTTTSETFVSSFVQSVNECFGIIDRLNDDLSF